MEGRGVPDFEDWWEKFSGDSEFDASLCFLVFGEGRLAGVALCWTSAFLKDLAVRPDMRRLGIGENLLRIGLPNLSGERCAQPSTSRSKPAMQTRFGSTSV